MIEKIILPERCSYMAIPGHTKFDFFLKKSNLYSIEEKKELLMGNLIVDLCGFYGVKFEEFNNNLRSREIKYIIVRQMYCYIYYNNNDTSLKKAGEIFGYDHSTVINCIKMIKNRLDTNSDFSCRYEKLKHELFLKTGYNIKP